MVVVRNIAYTPVLFYYGRIWANQLPVNERLGLTVHFTIGYFASHLNEVSELTSSISLERRKHSVIQSIVHVNNLAVVAVVAVDVQEGILRPA